MDVALTVQALVQIVLIIVVIMVKGVMSTNIAKGVTFELHLTRQALDQFTLMTMIAAQYWVRRIIFCAIQ